jgi:hypothetical protein
MDGLKDVGLFATFSLHGNKKKIEKVGSFVIKKVPKPQTLKLGKKSKYCMVLLVIEK